MIVSPTSIVTVSSSTAEENCQKHTKSRIRSAIKGSRRWSATTKTPTSVIFVSFEQNVDVQEVPHLRDLPPEERAATWYDAEDFEKIKRSLVVTLKLMIANKPVGTDQCTRGLEFRTPAGAKVRKQNKLKALTAVWNEQVAQWKENNIDDEAIRRVYLEHSVKCSETARKIGMRDEMAVRTYLGKDQDRDHNSSSSHSSLAVEDEVVSSIMEGFVQHQSCVPSAA